MKSLILSTVLALSATSAFAGGVTEPQLEPEVVVKQTNTSSNGILVPLLLLVVVAAAIASSSGSDPVTK